MDKATLRRIFLARRKALTPEEVKRSSQRIADHFFRFLKESSVTSSPLSIHTFLPIRRQNEIDTWFIIRRIWEHYNQIGIVVSVTDPLSSTLYHYPLSAHTALIENRWGIPEPVTLGQLSLPSTAFDMVLVPLLAFDQTGQRVGYGGGFYDRFLAGCRPDCLKVGLSLFEPIELVENIEPTDVALDLCITPQHIHTTYKAN